MPEHHADVDPPADAGHEKRRELWSFLFLTIVLAPLLSVMIVGGYGFLVWIYQIIAGPPGPPGA